MKIYANVKKKQNNGLLIFEINLEVTRKKNLFL